MSGVPAKGKSADRRNGRRERVGGNGHSPGDGNTADAATAPPDDGPPLQELQSPNLPKQSSPADQKPPARQQQQQPQQRRTSPPPQPQRAPPPPGFFPPPAR